MSRSARCVGALLVVALGAFAWSPAHAASNGSWQVLPTQTDRREQSRVFFVYEVSAGDELHDAVTISNLTEQPLTLRLRAADAVNAAGTGAWALQPAAAGVVDVGTWLHVATPTVVVPAQGRVDVPFVVRVPANASPGDHAGGIIAADSEPGTAVVGGSGRVQVVREVGVRVYARVAGTTTPRMDIGALRVARRAPVLAYVTGSGRTTVRYRVRNTGNVRLTVTSDVRFTDAFGRTVKRLAPLRMADMLPGADVPVTQQWRAAPPVGRLTAHVQLRAAGVTATASTSLWAIPWVELALLAAVVVFAVGLVRWRRARRRTAQGDAVG